MVATPDSLIDLLEKEKINLKMIKYLIVDEANKILEKNFKEDIKKIIEHTSEKKERQNLLFSSTFNYDIKDLAKYFMNNYYYFGNILEPFEQIKYEFIKVQNYNDKINALISFLKKPETQNKSVLIFLRTKNGVHELENILKKENISKKNVLITTDMSVRDLDFKNVYFVENFDLPQTNEDYIQRVGRVRHFGQEGRILNFIDDINDSI